ncbi:proteic killer suppression protein [Ruminococcaceae bacterium YRB3002]|nr:proteic killer suppression protein [Ruminococcaceae bacterium YRB3002]
MKKLIGAELTRSVKKRYDQIVAFSSFYSLQKSGFGKMESLSGKMKDSYSLRLTANYRLIVRPKSESRSSEMLMQCDTLIIEGVVDYHGSDRKYNWLIP